MDCLARDRCAKRDSRRVASPTTLALTLHLHLRIHLHCSEHQARQKWSLPTSKVFLNNSLWRPGRLPYSPHRRIPGVRTRSKCRRAIAPTLFRGACVCKKGKHPTEVSLRRRIGGAQVWSETEVKGIMVWFDSEYQVSTHCAIVTGSTADKS